MPRHSTLPAGVSPRGLNITQAAEYWGCGPSTFKKLVKLGIVLPIDMAGCACRHFYRQALADTITALAKAPAGPTTPPHPPLPPPRPSIRATSQTRRPAAPA